MRDGAAHLEACAASLVAQTLDDWEAVVVDDGSVDATPELLRAWAAAEPRVRVVRQERSGVVRALERARSLARAPFLARMDADDVAAPRRLERQLALMEGEPALGACGTGVEYFPRSLVRDGARRYEAWLNGLTTPEAIERDLFVECPLAHPTFFLRADAVAAVGGYRDAGWPEDYDLLLRLWAAGARLGRVPEVLLRWREGPVRLSRTSPAYSAEAFRRCKVHWLGRTLLPSREGVVVWGAGPTGKAFSRTLRGAGVEVRAFVELDPRKIGQEIHGAPVVAPAGVDRFRGAFCLAAVAQPGAREEVRAALVERGWREMEDFAAVA